MLVYLLCRHLEEERLNTAARKASWNLARSLSAQLTARSLLCWVPPLAPPLLCGSWSVPARRGIIMMFAKRLREGVRRGEITCSVRFWMRPHVTVGGRYRMDSGEIEVDSIETIGFQEITPELARASGFLGVLDLLKVAKHGKGETIYLVRFHYVPPSKSKRSAAKSKSRAG